MVATRSFVGFGLGPIQIGVFLTAALSGGRYGRVTVLEVDQRIATGARLGVVVNVATHTGLRHLALHGFDVLCPLDPLQRFRVIAALADADDVVTAVPSVAAYSSGPAPVAPLLVQALVRRRPHRKLTLYTAENHPRAAQALATALAAAGATRSQLRSIQLVDTVIGRMSGTRPPGVAGALALFPGAPVAVVVEEALATLTGPTGLAPEVAGLPFPQKPDLRPFEDAKLYGHNALHAVLAYQARLAGFQSMAELAGDEALMDRGRRAYHREITPMLLHRYGELADPFFSAEQLRLHGEELMVRLTSACLDDPVERVCRDPRRKLGATDRMVGTMRACIEAGVVPTELARGTAAALVALNATARRGTAAQIAAALVAVWAQDDGKLAADPRRERWPARVSTQVAAAMGALIRDYPG